MCKKGLTLGERPRLEFGIDAGRRQLLSSRQFRFQEAVSSPLSYRNYRSQQPHG
jgi:hypothetical protein